MNRLVKFILMVLAGLALAACGNNYPQQTNKFDPRGQPYGIVLQRKESQSPRILILNTDEYYLNRKEQSVLPRLLEDVNGGQYDIVQVQTYYKNGSLIAARLDYLPEGVGDGSGKKLRLKILKSDEYYYTRQEKEVKPLLEKANNDTNNILQVQTVFVDGYLLAVEIWYLEE